MQLRWRLLGGNNCWEWWELSIQKCYLFSLWLLRRRFQSWRSWNRGRSFCNSEWTMITLTEAKYLLRLIPGILSVRMNSMYWQNIYKYSAFKWADHAIPLPSLLSPLLSIEYEGMIYNRRSPEERETRRGKSLREWKLFYNTTE